MLRLARDCNVPRVAPWAGPRFGGTPSDPSARQSRHLGWLSPVAFVVADRLIAPSRRDGSNLITGVCSISPGQLGFDQLWPP